MCQTRQVPEQGSDHAFIDLEVNSRGMVKSQNRGRHGASDVDTCPRGRLCFQGKIK